MNYIVQRLPVHLFWDSDISKLDDVESHEKIIIRTFERGDLEDMALVMAYYGDEICVEVLKEANYLNESAMLFSTAFLGIRPDEFAASSKKQYHEI